MDKAYVLGNGVDEVFKIAKKSHVHIKKQTFWLNKWKFIIYLKI